MRPEENAHLVVPMPGGGGAGPSSGAPPPPPRPGGAPGAPQPQQPQQPQQLPAATAQRASASVLGAPAKGKPSLRPLNTAQCTSIIDAMKEGTLPSKIFYVLSI